LLVAAWCRRERRERASSPRIATERITALHRRQHASLLPLTAPASSPRRPLSRTRAPARPAADVHRCLPVADRLGLAAARRALLRRAAARLGCPPPPALLGLPPDDAALVLRLAPRGSGRAKGALLAAWLGARDAEGRLDAEAYAVATSGVRGGEGAGGDLEGAEVGGLEAVGLAALAARFGDAALEEVWARQAAEGFSELRGESLAGLPARVLARVLGDDELAAESEDEVWAAAEAYVAQRGEGLGAGERREVWACVRFGLCSEEARAKMMALEVAKELGYEWLVSSHTPKKRRRDGDGGAGHTAKKRRQEPAEVRGPGEQSLF